MVDLHMHSTASDGTDNIEKLLKKVRESGISVFSVTDHDTIEGSLEMEKIVPKDMTFIRGVEFSCKSDAGKFHLLAYNYDPSNKDILQLLDKAREKRRRKLETRLDFLENEFGIKLSEEESARLRSMNSVGKPHLGNLLVSKGLAPDKGTAIKKYIDPCSTGSTRLNGIKVIKTVLLAGGIPVLAHPFGGTNEKEVSMEDFEKQLSILTEAGLQGLECYYSKYNEEQIKILVKRAEDMDLCISGGSDYHGKNKKVGLGTLNSYGLEVRESMLTLLERIKQKKTF
ncbi:MAG: PHP domain-containing protein [Lachnospiraceae bacterium]|nr:PHP domain-containing protein [Lachnospiraceae bacterium]